MEKINEINQLEDENLKIKKIKEAEILSIQLDSANNITELTDELKKVADEKDRVEKELESIKFMNEYDRDVVIDAEDIVYENTSVAEKKLLEKDDRRTNYLRDSLSIPERLIPEIKNEKKLNKMFDNFQNLEAMLGRNELNIKIKKILSDDPDITSTRFTNKIKKLIESLEKEEELELEENEFDRYLSMTNLQQEYDIPERLIPELKDKENLDEMLNTFENLEDMIGGDKLNNKINKILSDNPNITQSEFKSKYTALFEEVQRQPQEQLQPEERQKQIDRQIRKAEIDERFNKTVEIESLQNKIKKKQELIKNQQENIIEIEEELDQLINEYESLIFTFDEALEAAGIENISEIDEIDNERQRESLITLYKYINETKEQLVDPIELAKKKISEVKSSYNATRNELDIDEARLEQLKLELEEMKKKKNIIIYYYNV